MFDKILSMPLVLYVIALSRNPEIGKNIIWISINNSRVGQIITPCAGALNECLPKLRHSESPALAVSSYLGKKKLGSNANFNCLRAIVT